MEVNLYLSCSIFNKNIYTELMGIFDVPVFCSFLIYIFYYGGLIFLPHFYRACYGVLRFVMESGAKGCEVCVVPTVIFFHNFSGKPQNKHLFHVA